LFRNTGSLEKIINAPQDINTSLGWPYSIYVHPNGSLVGSYDGPQKFFFDSSGNLAKKVNVYGQAIPTSEGYLFEVSKTKYYLYSPTGELLRTTTERPSELGLVTEKSLPSGRYKSTIRYPDITYQIISSQPIVRYYRDSRKYLHQVDSFTETVNDDDEITAYRIHTYSTCGKEVSVFNMPKSQYEPMPPEAEKYPTWKPVPIMEYGEPIISSNGDAYCWVRTSTEYKIFKWTWQDDPIPPADIPDTPINLTISSSTTAINLAWKAPLQDPGCVTGYEIARSTLADGSYSTIGTVTNGVFSYSDTSAVVGTTYYYMVRAVGGDGYSEYSNAVSGQR